MLRSKAMTIGQLSRRTGVPIKLLRTYEDLGFLLTGGRSEGTYRLFGEETLQCVQVAQRLRAQGLTLKEMQALIRRTWKPPDALVEGLLDESLTQALARIDTHISAFWHSRLAAPSHYPGLSHLPWCTCWPESLVLVCFSPSPLSTTMEYWMVEPSTRALTLPPQGECTLSESACLAVRSSVDG